MGSGLKVVGGRPELPTRKVNTPYGGLWVKFHQEPSGRMIECSGKLTIEGIVWLAYGWLVSAFSGPFSVERHSLKDDKGEAAPDSAQVAFCELLTELIPKLTAGLDAELAFAASAVAELQEVVEISETDTTTARRSLQDAKRNLQEREHELAEDKSELQRAEAHLAALLRGENPTASAASADAETPAPKRSGPGSADEILFG